MLLFSNVDIFAQLVDENWICGFIASCCIQSTSVETMWREWARACTTAAQNCLVHLRRVLSYRAFLTCSMLVDVLVTRILPSPRLLQSMWNSACVLRFWRADTHLCNDLQVSLLLLCQFERWYRCSLLLLACDMLQLLWCHTLYRL